MEAGVTGASWGEELEGREERRWRERKAEPGWRNSGERRGAPSTRSQAAARTPEGVSISWRASKAWLTPSKPAATNEWFVTSKGVNEVMMGCGRRCRIKSRG